MKKVIFFVFTGDLMIVPTWLAMIKLKDKDDIQGSTAVHSPCTTLTLNIVTFPLLNKHFRNDIGSV